MVAAPSRARFVEPAAHAHADESVFDPGRSEFQMLRAKGRPDIRLALRPLSDGDALQKLCERSIPAVALQSVSGRRKRASRNTRSPPTQSANDDLGIAPRANPEQRPNKSECDDPIGRSAHIAKVRRPT